MVLTVNQLNNFFNGKDKLHKAKVDGSKVHFFSLKNYNFSKI